MPSEPNRGGRRVGFGSDLAPVPAEPVLHLGEGDGGVGRGVEPVGQRGGHGGQARSDCEGDLLHRLGRNRVAVLRTPAIMID